MLNEVFTTTVEDAFNRSKRLLIKKEKEYSNGMDRLSQFYRVGSAQDQEPTEALTGMMMKHVISILDMAKDPLVFPSKVWQEKITDLRNYTFLLDALVLELHEEDKIE